ncbi:MAG TPA: DUF2069 domain-containing protein [Steroidobacter sp.]|jgi:uncharacterized membrane protein|nr:DUF2069 domain-containing protein [Steroidobacteraceae bacterium]HLS81976.1 DUF2069 domain-containing protein [Steroidobacter sp.]
MQQGNRTAPAVLQLRLRRAAAGATALLSLIVVLWALKDGISIAATLIAVAAGSPLWIAVPALHSGRRRAYGWMALGIAPYLTFALMEAIANPAARGWAAASLVAGFATFVLLVGYLRVSRMVSGAAGRPSRV